MFGELEVLRDLLAPTKYGAAVWAIGFLVIVGSWCLRCIFLVRKLLDRIRLEDSALWLEFGCPQSWDDFSKAGNWPTFRRIRVDQAFAQQFNQHVIAEIRRLQRYITAGLLLMTLLGLLVMYLVWPHR